MACYIGPVQVHYIDWESITYIHSDEPFATGPMIQRWKDYHMALTLLLIGCMQLGTSGGETHTGVSKVATEILLTTDSTKYVSPREITLKLVNNSEGDVGFNLCGSGLEQRVNKSWERAEATETFDGDAITYGR